MKRIVCLALALCLAAGMLCGCGKKEEKESSSSQAASSAAASPAPVSSAPVQMAKAVKVDADGGLNIRSQPSTDGEILGLAEDGSMLPLLVEKPSDGWYQVEYQGKTAYVSAEYAEAQDVTLEQYNKLKEEGETSSSPESASSGASSSPASGGSSASPKPSASSEAPSSNPLTGGEDGE